MVGVWVRVGDGVIVFVGVEEGIVGVGAMVSVGVALA